MGQRTVLGLKLLETMSQNQTAYIIEAMGVYYRGGKGLL